MKYNQLVVCRAITDSLADLQSAVSKHFDIRIKCVDEYETIPNDEYLTVRRDVLFYIHDKDISSFAVKRFGMPGVFSWWEDALNNEGDIIPEDIKEKYAA